MNINRDNYEAYFLDYAEGNLSAGEEEILHRFLKFNPDLSIELDAFSIVPLTKGDEVFPGKSLLKKNFPGVEEDISISNFDMFCIAYLEGDLSEEQKTDYKNFLSENKDLQAKHEGYELTFLAEEKIAYPHKNKLKRRLPIIIQWKVLMPIAAAAAVLLMFIIGPTEQNGLPELAVAVEQAIGENDTKADVEEKKAASQVPAQTTLKVIRGSKAPVPVTDYKKKEEERKVQANGAEEQAKPTERKPQIAKMELNNVALQEISPSYDQIVYEAIQSPAIHFRSLSPIEMARYQFQKASNAMEDEDVFIWSLASKGLKEINRLTGNNMQLLASKDDDGSISGIQFNSRLLNITTPISKE